LYLNEPKFDDEGKKYTILDNNIITCDFDDVQRFHKWCSINLYSPFILKPKKIDLKDTLLWNTFLVPKDVLKD
jgi:hypothetical protein